MTHCLMLWWIDGELYVLHSTDETDMRGIVRVKFDEMMEVFEENSYKVALLTLGEEQRKIFNDKKAFEFFEKVENSPYGYENFLFSAIDNIGNYE